MEKKDMTVENENSRQIKSEERLKHNEQTSFNYTLNGKADEVGLIAKGSASNAGGNNELSEKKKKERDENLKLLLEGNKDFKAFMDDFGDKLDDYNRVADRQSRRQAAFESGDWDQYRLILINDYDMNADDVAAMNNEDFQKLDPELQDLDEFTKETLKHELIQLAKDYDEEHGFTDEQKQALQELMSKSGIEGIDFDEVFSDVKKDANVGFVNDVENATLGTVSETFNLAANDKQNPFDLDNQNKSAPDPFSSTPSNSPNPFG
ncbi:MAG: hypothetical protein R8N23_10560 [Reichenbachiella sp.]|uniref:hypothetical protein n=1 Tax=Reichenbachiella sp. TaxID=2184521 RepID=UPI002966DC1B|nr:hypothetical protein [Reichenbachiella sp.]MDW3210300.1 hypothetical protein [Reichenbachiella sp.]